MAIRRAGSRTAFVSMPSVTATLNIPVNGARKMLVRE